MFIRKGNFGDIDDLHRIELAQFKERAFSRVHFRNYIKKGQCYVLATNDAVLGYCVVFTRANSRISRIQVIAIDPCHTGKGYGTTLLEYVEKGYWIAGYDTMQLEVNVLNIGAIKLYKSRGYEAMDTLPGYYGEGTLAIKMIKRLN
jgi:ribosomal-protein-alanine N-acetyltransferase